MGQSSNPKYQIKIVKAGIGDPLLAIGFEFTNSDGTYTIPSESEPLVGLKFNVDVGFEGGSGGGSSWVATINFGDLKSAGPYHCDVPFDNLTSFRMGDQVSVDLGGFFPGGYPDFSGPGGSGNSWANAFTYHNPEVLFFDVDVAYGYFPS